MFWHHIKEFLNLIQLQLFEIQKTQTAAILP